VDEFTFVLALLGVLWSAYQQYHISSMCKSCPFYLDSKEEKV
jgi:hypothetical protein